MRCPACAADEHDVRTFWRADTRVPVHSCLLMPTAAEARDYPAR